MESFRLAELAVKEELSGEENNQTLKQYWVDLGNQLEIEGILKESICSTAAKLIIQKKSEKLKLPIDEIRPSGYFYRVYQENNWVNPNLGRPKNKPNPDKPKNNFEQENNSWLIEIKRMEDFLKSFKSYISHNHFDSLIPQQESSETLTIIKNTITHANERFNDKLKMKPMHYSIIMPHWMETSGNALSVQYYKHVTKKEVFVEKQYRKIVLGIMKKMPARYEPNNTDQAEACGFSGVSCPKCDSFRTEYIPGAKVIETTDEHGNPIRKIIGIRNIHCFVEDKDYEAPMPAYPATEVNESKWA